MIRLAIHDLCPSRIIGLADVTDASVDDPVAAVIADPCPNVTPDVRPIREIPGLTWSKAMTGPIRVVAAHEHGAGMNGTLFELHDEMTRHILDGRGASNEMGE